MPMLTIRNNSTAEELRLQANSNALDGISRAMAAWQGLAIAGVQDDPRQWMMVNCR